MTVSPDERKILHPNPDFVRSVLFVVLVTGLSLAIWRIHSALLMLFAAVVLAVVWGGIARFLERSIRLPYRVGLYLLPLALIAACFLVGSQFYHLVARELRGLQEALPASMSRLEELPWGRWLRGNLDQVGSMASAVFPRFGQFALSSMGVISTLFVILFLALFLVQSPALYRRGTIRLLPRAWRGHGAYVVDECGRGLWRWLIGQLFSMALIATLVTIALSVLGIRFAVILGVLAGVFQFIPYIGPFLWVVPAALVTMGQGLGPAAQVLAVYVVIQTLEGNFITPMVQDREVHIPPVLSLLGTLAMGLLFGPLGLIVGTPLVVVLLTIHRLVYERWTLGDLAPTPAEEADA